MTQVITPSQVIDTPVVLHRARESRSQASNRWVREGRRAEADKFREDVRLECLAAGLPRFEANEAAWDQCLKAFPPVGDQPIDAEPVEPGLPSWLLACHGVEVKSASASASGAERGGNRATVIQSPASDATRLKGLGDIPPTWPPLPANASLAAEIGWVQSNRLYVVEEKSTNITVVHLDRAHEPAPSRAAIGWLETSIRSYAKFVDVASKCMGDETDEAGHVRRETLALDEIRALLDEMHRD